MMHIDAQLRLMTNNIVSKEVKGKQAFTFSELLIGLIVLASVLYLFQIIIWHYDGLAENFEASRARDFSQFLVIFEKEMDHYQVLNASDDMIYVRDIEENNFFEFVCQQETIYKRPGFHPFLQGVLAWQIEVEENFLKIWVLMDDQKLYQGHIRLARYQPPSSLPIR
ncbi:hypothetical protein [Ignavigranum ruoffiae]|uniref:hypothetical protein n=1 Tax=Ignavigranum ruoffiae TaxID=89093 RepID=UPI002353EBEE|nr:hypothetical protein [Ignavigranum ruoffiae]